MLLKDESYRLGLPAFKILGASWAAAKAIIQRLGLDISDVKDDSGTSISLERLGFAAQAVGLVLFAATDGNHGRAVARMAKYLGIGARIYVPCALDQEAKSNIASEGAGVVNFEGNYDETVLEASKACGDYPNGNGLLISDTALVFGDEISQWIVDGYQTMFDEIDEQAASLTGGRCITHVLTPVGVGSLCQAVLTHFSRVSKCAMPAIITVEPETAACLKSSLEAGEIVTVPTGHTICSGLCCGTLSRNGWSVMKDGVTAAMSISDTMVDLAVKDLHEEDIEAGPCGAATLAGLRQIMKVGELNLDPGSIVLVLCTEGTRSYSLIS